MRRHFIASLAFLLLWSGLAQGQSIPGLVAKRETAALSADDRLAAYDAEQAVLAQDGSISGYQWQGPNGAYGTIIAGAVIAMTRRSRPCRVFIHIVHHPKDGGLNPTFHARICQGSSGQWEPQQQ
jgi:surface antigen